MDVIVGDIHGCYNELRDLLDRVGPGASDRIVSVGDLVDRGPRSLEVVRFFRDTPNAHAILGNHEDKHLRWRRGELAPAFSQRLCAEQAGSAYGEILEHIATLPLFLELGDLLVVHAGYEPALPLDAQPRNVLLRCKWPGQRGLSGSPELWTGRCDGSRAVVYGHHVFETPRIEGRTYGIDTGACHGRFLTALLWPSGQCVSVPARADHWRLARSASRGGA